jgi:sigma-B regulation protein RsbU (phosphoserine phosphatase)
MNQFAQFGGYLIEEADPAPETFRESRPEQAETLALLYDVSRELTAILDRDCLLQKIAQRVKKIVNYHVFTVMLWNEATQLLEGVFAMHYENSIPARFRVPLHKGITGTAAGERRALRIGDAAQDPRFIGDCGSPVQVRSEMVIPLLLQEQLIGVLDLESTQLHAFTAEHERMLTTLASFIAVALENSRLYHEARESAEKLRSDLDTAREIQRQLLPNGAREVPGLDLAAAYLPAQMLGGDFYDFLPYGEGRLGFALGDVSGKGTAAALYGSLAIGVLREHAVAHACPPGEMLALLNSRLHTPRLDARFIAMLFGVYDARTRKLSLANAGAPYPLLAREGAVEEIRLEGVPLGLLTDTAYDETTVELRPGDLVLFASDGILEAENAGQEAFGAERLNALLISFAAEDSAQQVAAKILAATDEYAGRGAAAYDDRTLVVMRVTEDSAADFSKMPIIY